MDHMFTFWNEESAKYILEILKSLVFAKGYITLAQVCMLTDNRYFDSDKLKGWVNLETVKISKTFSYDTGKVVTMLIFPPLSQLIFSETGDLL